MNSTGKIIGSMVLLGGGAYGLSRLLKTANTAKKMSMQVLNVDKPALKSGAVVLSVNVAFDNPTDNPIVLKKPYLTAYFNDSEVGNSIPSNEQVTIKANERTIIKGINIQVPFLNLGTLALSLVTGKTPKMAFDILVKTVANGLPYTDKKHFEL